MLYKKSLRQLVLFCLLVMSALWMAAAQAKLKQVMAITPNEWDSNGYYVFFDDDTFSNYSIPEKRFMLNRNLTEWNDNTWPRNNDGSFKRVVTILINEWDKQKRIYFFDDGTGAQFNIDTKQWATDPYNVASEIPGWPKDANGRFKQVTAITQNKLNSEQSYFFFDDLTVSNYSKSAQKFLENDEGNRSLRYLNNNWPRNANRSYKKVTAIVNNHYSSVFPFPFLPVEKTYFFDDGTKLNFSITTNTFYPNSNGKTEWWDSSVGWPEKPQPTSFNSSIHKVTGIKINYGVIQPIYHIYADGRDQAPVYVWVQIEDKNTGEFVELSDDDSAIGSSGQPLNLVTLYDYQLGQLPGLGSFLDINKLNTFDFSFEWQVSRTKKVYPYAKAVVPYPLNNLQDDNSSTHRSQFVDGWNRYTYYVTSTEVNAEKILCARVGSMPDYVYSCSEHLNESARIRAHTPSPLQ